MLLMGDAVAERVFGLAKSTRALSGDTIVYRYVQQWEPGFVQARQPVRVIVTWPYKGNRGMPATAELDRMDALEAALESLEATGLATLALVTTGNDLREWTYYATSESAFISDLNKALKSSKPFPIEISIAEDPTWSTYLRFTSSIKQ